MRQQAGSVSTDTSSPGVWQVVSSRLTRTSASARLTDAETLQNTNMMFVFGAAVLYVFAFIAGFGHELEKTAFSSAHTT